MNKRNLSILKAKWKIHIDKNTRFLYACLIPTEILYCYEHSRSFQRGFNGSISYIKEIIKKGKMDYSMWIYIHDVSAKTKKVSLFEKAFSSLDKEIADVLNKTW